LNLAEWLKERPAALQNLKATNSLVNLLEAAEKYQAESVSILVILTIKPLGNPHLSLHRETKLGWNGRDDFQIMKCFALADRKELWELTKSVTKTSLTMEDVTLNASEEILLLFYFKLRPLHAFRTRWEKISCISSTEIGHVPIKANTDDGSASFNYALSAT